MKKKPKLLFVLWIGILVLLCIGWKVLDHLSSLPGPPPTPPEPRKEVVAKLWKQVLQHAAAPALNDPNNRYTLVEFGDFQCPLCGKMEPIVYNFVTKNPKQVSFYFVQRPLPTLHKWAVDAAETAQIASAQGKFWKMYTILYANQLDLEPGLLPNYAAEAGLKQGTFGKEFGAHTYLPAIIESQAFCDQLNIKATPTFLFRDNVTGEIQASVGSVKIVKIIQHPPWQQPTQAASAPAVPSS